MEVSRAYVGHIFILLMSSLKSMEVQSFTQMEKCMRLNKSMSEKVPEAAAGSLGV